MAVKVEKKSKREITEEYLLALILQAEEKAGGLIKTLNEDYLSSLAVKRVFGYLRSYLTKSNNLMIKNFVKILPEELKETANRLYLYNLEGLTTPWPLLQKEWQKSLKEIEKIALHDRLKRLRDELETAKEEASQTLEAEIVRISRRLNKL
jgi:hypothetical protein